MRTKIRSRSRVAAAALVALSVAVAACGSDDDDSTSESAVETTSAASPTTEAATPTTAGGGAETTTGGAVTTAAVATTVGGPATTAVAVTTAAPESTAPADAGYADSELDLEATMNVTNDGNPANLDPHMEPTQGSTPYWIPVYDTLTDISVSGVLGPRLAESWEFSEDGLTLTMEIRGGVKFHDGTALDAAGVKANLDRARGGLETSTQKNVLAAITDVQASGPLEVTITLNVYDPALPWVLGTAAGAIVNPKAIAAGTDLKGGGDGTGPYVVTAFEPDVKVTYERAADPNWDPKVGKLAGFTINFLTDYQVALNGLEAGQYDMIRINGLGSAVKQAVDSGDFIRTELPSLQTLAFWLNDKDPVFADVRVRQAFQYALDREGIANAVFDGGSECSAASQAYPFKGDGLYVEGYDPYPYDPAKATKLLEDAGAVGTEITITDIGATNTGNLMQAAQPMLEAVGFKVNLVVGTAAEVAPGFQKGTIQVAVIPNARQAHPTITLKRYWLTGGPYHLALDEDQPILDVLKTLGPKSTDQDTAAANEKIAKILSEDIATLVVACNVVWSMVHENSVVNVNPRTFFLNMRTIAVLKD